MKNRPIHQNLDTSFVNLSALIKYLRRRQFLGSVKIQLNGYNADIELKADNQMKVSEHDQISGRVSTGEEALQRLLIRAREPGGTINVYQLVEIAETDKPIEKPKQPVKQQLQTEQKETETILDAEIIHPKTEPFEAKIPQNKNGKNGNGQNGKLSVPKIRANGNLKDDSIKIEKPKNPATQEKSLPDFPFSLTNKVESKAKQKELTNEEWQTLLKLTVELLTVVDKTLATEELDFSAAFRKARTEIADDYPFLNPNAEVFDYSKGRIKMTEKVNEKMFVSSIIETLRRILEKLESSQKFERVHRRASQNIIALMNKRSSHYNKFGITPHIRRILGI